MQYLTKGLTLLAKILFPRENASTFFYHDSRFYHGDQQGKPILPILIRKIILDPGKMLFIIWIFFFLMKQND